MVRHPTVDDARTARDRIAGLVERTPLVPSQVLMDEVGGEVRLKLDCLQPTRAFKLRGAANAMVGLPTDQRRRGVVTYSTGNFGRAVAHVAARLGMPAVVCVSERTAPEKIASLSASGATVKVRGRSQDEAALIATDLATAHGLALIDPIEDPAVIAGHATAGLELVESWPEVDTVVVPVSGGALAAGVGVVAEDHGGIRVVGVSTAQGAAMAASLEAGRPVEVEEVDSLADSLQGGIGADNTHTFEMCRRLLSSLVRVGEADLASALVHGYLAERLVLEGAGAAPIAALRRHRSLMGERICLLLTGAMIDPRRLLRLVEEAAA